MVRKEDPDIRAAVNSSEALQRVQQMEIASISPQLVFFEKGLPETTIQQIVRRLHGDIPKIKKHTYLLTL